MISIKSVIFNDFGYFNICFHKSLFSKTRENALVPV
jgi:hypothetical protein